MCPECGCLYVFKWMIGWSTHKDDEGVVHSHDPNRNRCVKCGKTWFISCPACGEIRGEPGQLEPSSEELEYMDSVAERRREKDAGSKTGRGN